MKKFNKLLVAGLTAAGLCAAGITTGMRLANLIKKRQTADWLPAVSVSFADQASYLLTR